MNWSLIAELTVALVAIYGAVLSTLNAISHYKAKKIKVAVKLIMERGYFSEERKGREFQYTLRAKLIAINNSPNRGVSLETAGIVSSNRLAKSRQTELLHLLINRLLRIISFNRIKPIYSPRISNKLNVIVDGDLPYQLEPDNSHMVLVKPKFAELLEASNKITGGKIMIRGFFKDTSGNIYDSDEPDEVDWSRYIPHP